MALLLPFSAPLLLLRCFSQIEIFPEQGLGQLGRFRVMILVSGAFVEAVEMWNGLQKDGCFEYIDHNVYS